jgi:hypothetical protein
MTDNEGGSEGLIEQLSKHLRLDTNGFMVMRARDKGIREAWAGLDERDRICAKLLANIRVTHELEAQYVALQKGLLDTEVNTPPK